MLAARRITGIVPTRRDPNRASIRVDGKAVATVSFRHVQDLNLHVGRPWDDALADAVAQAALYDKAMKRALNRLDRRAMSRRELDRKLKELEFDEPTRQRVLDRLAELGLLDDAAFARAIVRETLARKPAGRRLLQQKLFQKGIDRRVADAAIAEALDATDQSAAAVELVRKRLRSMQRLDPVARKRRLYGLLARRGFDPDAIDDALRAAAADIDAADSP